MKTGITTADRTIRTIQRCLNVLLSWRPYIGAVATHVAFGDLEDAATALQQRTIALHEVRYALETDAHALKRLRDDLLVGAIRPALTIARLRLPNIRELQSFRAPHLHSAPSELILAGHALAGAINRNTEAFTREGLPANAAVYMASLARAINTSLDAAASHRKQYHLQREGIDRALGYGTNAIAILDAALGSQLKRDKTLARQWRAARGLNSKTRSWGSGAGRDVAVGE